MATKKTKAEKPEEQPEKNTGEIKIWETKVLPIEQLRELENNVNYQSDAQFNKLVASIQEDGFTEPITVAPNEDGTYTVVGGNHRYKAAKFLEMKKLPCTIREDLTDKDMRDFKAVRLNIIRGQIDPVMLTKMVNKMKGKYSMEVMKDLMGFYDDALFDKLYKQARAALPPHMKEQLDKSKKNIKNIDDLSNVINQLFTEYGDTVPYNFMFFVWGGKVHFMVKMNKKLKDTMTKISKLCMHDEEDINALLLELLKNVDKEFDVEGAEGFSRHDEE